MTKQDRQKLSILVVLVAVLGLTVFMGYRLNQPSTTVVAEQTETKTSTNPPAPSDARINLGMVDKGDDPEEDVGRTNVFQYRKGPPPPPQHSGAGAAFAQPPQTVINNPPPVMPPTPVSPPPPPPIPLQYQGFALNRSPGGGMTAFLATGTTDHYNVTVGEVLMGRYRITRISETFVEIEDLEFNRRQTLPLIK
jgi:hypothetical protein